MLIVNEPKLHPFVQGEVVVYKGELALINCIKIGGLTTLLTINKGGNFKMVNIPTNKNRAELTVLWKDPSLGLGTVASFKATVENKGLLLGNIVAETQPSVIEGWKKKEVVATKVQPFTFK